MKKAPIHALTINQPWAFWIVRPDLLGPERRRAYAQGLMKGMVEVELPSARQLAVQRQLDMDMASIRITHCLNKNVTLPHSPSWSVFGR